MQMTFQQLQKITDDVVSYAQAKKSRAACYAASALSPASIHLYKLSHMIPPTANEKIGEVESNMQLIQLRVGLFQTYCQMPVSGFMMDDASRLLGAKKLKRRAALIANAEALKEKIKETEMLYAPKLVENQNP